ncbi:uncharacterized protein HKW66_Vig0070830 [Vigna angularis]|uniref:Uncharacterized protein n=1 Tax=Phaseolus angularis TaxID=3914 RepID=A0A8T0K7C6_PHAAN|nr:uncharacterized protein HKW66_Vig0070830 [Vigna angularis]
MLKDLVRWVSMALPCWTENVCGCAKIVLKTMVHEKMGIIDSNIFTCSTCPTLHNLHALSFVFVPSWTLIQALFKNLIKRSALKKKLARGDCEFASSLLMIVEDSCGGGHGSATWISRGMDEKTLAQRRLAVA